MQTTREALDLDKRSVVESKNMDMPTGFIWVVAFFAGGFEYGDGDICELLRWIKKL
jgi:hypothetical protein